jgi:hypothetical protein
MAALSFVNEPLHIFRGEALLLLSLVALCLFPLAILFCLFATGSSLLKVFNALKAGRVSAFVW